MNKSRSYAELVGPPWHVQLNSNGIIVSGFVVLFAVTVETIMVRLIWFDPKYSYHIPLM